MIMVHIEHPVGDYDSWKATFDRDPIGRQRGGVRRYRIMRPLDDGLRVAIDLEFDDRPAAVAFRDALVSLWATPGAGALGIGQPEVELVEIAEYGDY